MIRTLCPASSRRYSSLSIFGPIVDDFSRWLVNQRYSRAYLKHRICLLPHIEAILIRRGIRHVKEIEQADWRACREGLLRRFPDLTGTTNALERYLRAQNLVSPADQRVIGTANEYLRAYAHFLETVCGAAASTTQQNSYTAAEFLAYLKIESHPDRLRAVTPHDLESFLKRISLRVSRASLRAVVVRLRSFLRFLAVRGEIPSGLDRQIDSPRVYREEHLPGALPWETVRRFLDSIDRSSLVGLRDFTMFFLMAIYGLRASDVVALTLDNIHWRRPALFSNSL